MTRDAVELMEERSKIKATRGAMDFETMVDTYQADLLRYAAWILNDDREAAQDVVQNAFIKLFKALNHHGNGSSPINQPRGWLYRVTHNEAIDYLSRQVKARDLHQKAAQELPASYPEQQRRELEEKDILRITLKHVSKLKPSERQVIVLKLQARSNREIAKMTNRTQGNVGCILHHATKTLLKSLKKAGVI